MPALARGQASSCTNPELDLYITVNGVRTDVNSLEFVIREKVTDPASPAQVYPVTGRATVNLTDCPTGHKLSTGRYVAEYTPDLTALLGLYEITWYFKLTAGSPEQTFSEDFTVVSEVNGSVSDGYTTIEDLRDEGVPLTYTDARLTKLIRMASEDIDRFTGRHFEPRAKTILVDGTGDFSVLLDEPIIQVSDVKIVYPDVLTDDFETISMDEIRVYNRHLSQGLLTPDDRNNPRIEFVTGNDPDTGFRRMRSRVTNPIARWPEGNQNIQITGVFGYTDPDGTVFGKTPTAIQHACNLMVISNLPGAYNTEDRFDIRTRYMISKFKTRDQEISYRNSGLSRGDISGPFTGDPEIDRILLRYRRPSIVRVT